MLDNNINQMLSERQEPLWREYQILNSGYVGTITWGHSVVSLFATFTAAMIVGAGYVGTQLTALNATTVFIYSYSFKLGNLLLLLAGIVGLASALWGPAMVLAHAKQSRLFLLRMQELELRLGVAAADADKMFAHRQIAYEDRSVPSMFVKISTMLVLTAILLIWVTIIFKGAWLNI